MSFIISNRETGIPVLEVFSPSVAAKVNLSNYIVEPTLDYLYRLNREVKEQENV